MCFNPNRLLCAKSIYKGVEKTVIFWKTTPEEYQIGIARVPLKDLGYSCLSQCGKYGLIKNGFVTFNCRIELPCKKCLDCTLNHSKQWSVRCQLEAMQYPENSCFMVTLTYNDSNLPFILCPVYDSSTDSYVIKKYPTLNKQHSISFMKSLRQIFSRDFLHNGIRFFSCGEYGSKTFRPHYHFILFNCPLNDLTFLKMSKTGFPLYRSKILERSWTKGFVTVQPFSIECARYVAQYCVKKVGKHSLSLRQPEFINMSRRPGIGMQWFYKNMDSVIDIKDNFPQDYIYLSHKYKDSFKTLKYRVPSAFTRILKPFTDNSRGIDTLFNDVAFFLNDSLIPFYDCLLELNEKHKNEMNNAILSNLHKYGFSDDDLYNSNYLRYLKIRETELLNKFKPNRGDVLVC